jgi:hypothetical protein
VPTDSIFFWQLRAVLFKSLLRLTSLNYAYKGPALSISVRVRFLGKKSFPSRDLDSRKHLANGFFLPYRVNSLTISRPRSRFGLRSSLIGRPIPTNPCATERPSPVSPRIGRLLRQSDGKMLMEKYKADCQQRIQGREGTRFSPRASTPFDCDGTCPSVRQVTDHMRFEKAAREQLQPGIELDREGSATEATRCSPVAIQHFIIPPATCAIRTRRSSRFSSRSALMRSGLDGSGTLLPRRVPQSCPLSAKCPDSRQPIIDTKSTWPTVRSRSMAESLRLSSSDCSTSMTPPGPSVCHIK